MSTEITLIGNEGFRITTPSATTFIDAFYGAIPGLASAPAAKARHVRKADIVLVTHNHWDHFNAEEVAEFARRTGATVVGPGAVTQALEGAVPSEALVKLEPTRAARDAMAASQKVVLPGATITAFRTFHAMGHNSYLVETPTFRFFHDGDNEDTHRINAAALGRLDALLIGPWQGSGWVEFVEKLDPVRWFLMHLAEEEIAQHEAGTFLPNLCDHTPLPDRLVVLRPGQSLLFE
jgi:L-ascorbate metabolism protein UlaG (beta-lactamase superfamily)